MSSMREPEITARWARPDGLTARALSPGGGFLGECFENGFAVIRELPSFRELRRRKVTRGAVGIAVSPCGSRFATFYSPVGVRVYEVESGRECWSATRLGVGLRQPLTPVQTLDERHAVFVDGARELLVLSSRVFDAPRDPAIREGLFRCDLEDADAPPQRLPLEPPGRIACSGDGRFIMLMRGEECVVWDHARGTAREYRQRWLRVELRADERGIEHVWDPVARRYVDEEWLWYECTTPSHARRCRVHSPAMSRDGSMIAWMRGDLLEFGARRGDDVATIEGVGIRWSRPLALEHGGELVASVERRARQDLWLLALPTREWRALGLERDDPVAALEFDARGRLLIRYSSQVVALVEFT